MVNNKKIGKLSQLIVSIVALGTVLFFLDINGYLSFVYNTVNAVIMPVEFYVTRIARNVNYFTETVTSIGSLRRTNSQYQKRIVELEADLVEMESIKMENESLRAHIGSVNTSQIKYIESKVISYTPNVLGWRMKIDKGSVAGLYLGDLVVFKNVLIGTITETSNYYSYVTLLDNSESSFVGQDQRTGAEGVIVGRENSVYMSDVLQGDELSENDNIIVWNEKYSIPLLVGIVLTIEQDDSSPTKEAQIKPELEYKDLDYVFIIAGRDEE